MGRGGRVCGQAGGGAAAGKGRCTWQCSGVRFTSVKLVEKRIRRRVPPVSHTLSSSENWLPAGRKSWKAKYGCTSDTVMPTGREDERRAAVKVRARYSLPKTVGCVQSLCA